MGSTHAMGILAAALSFPGASLAAVPFVENFNDGAAASRWSIAYQTQATALPTTPPDGSVNFAFDYSTLGIASPNGGDTIGAFIQVNNTFQSGDEGETYIIYRNNFSVSGPFTLTADMYVYNDNGVTGVGTTELGMIGAFLDNNNPVAPYQWGTDGGPLAWMYSSEGGSADDLAVFREGGPGNTGYQGISDYDNLAAGTIPGFETGAPNSRGPAHSHLNGSWVQVRIESDGTFIRWYLNGVLIDTYDNSNGFYNEGNIFFGATDPFNSVNPAGGTIIDNIVFVPEPASALLLLPAVALLRRRTPRCRQKASNSSDPS